MSKKPKLTLDQLPDRCQAIAEGTRTMFEHTGGVVPLVDFLDSEGNHCLVDIEPIAVILGKDALATLIQQIIRTGAQDLAMVTEASMVIVHKDHLDEAAQDAKQGQLGSRPDAFDVVAITYATPTLEYALTAKIKRSPKRRPSLGAWEILVTDNSDPANRHKARFSNLWPQATDAHIAGLGNIKSQPSQN